MIGVANLQRDGLDDGKEYARNKWELRRHGQSMKAVGQGNTCGTEITVQELERQ